MNQLTRSVWFASWLFLSSWAIAPFATAQITPDKTLPVNSIAPPGCTVCTITGGTQRGVNLYHSFREFSIPTGGEAYFNNGLQIQTILTRVTGTSLSTIDGLLRANGTANLFLLNPNGIVFGPNARLQLGGSFLATTANSFKFADGSEFSAVNPQAPPLLAVSVAPGVQFGAKAPGSRITNRANLTTGQDLTLAADNLDLQGQLQAGRDLTLLATNTVIAQAKPTMPFVAAAGGNLLVQGNQGIDITILNHPQSGFWSGGNLVLRSTNPVVGDAHFYAGGNFQIEQLNGRTGNLLSPNDPIILTNGDVTLGDYAGASLHILAGGSVTLGNVTITSIGNAATNVATTINPNNTTLFNGSKTYADLARFNLTDYQPTRHSDGTVRSVDPVAVPITIKGNTQATLDVRAGVDWAALGGLPTRPVVVGSITPAPNYATGNTPSADISVRTYAEGRRETIQIWHQALESRYERLCNSAGLLPVSACQPN